MTTRTRSRPEEARLGGMAAVLETRLQQARRSTWRRSTSSPRSSRMNSAPCRPPARTARKQAGSGIPTNGWEISISTSTRRCPATSLTELATGGFIYRRGTRCFSTPGTEESSCPSHRPGRHQQGTNALREAYVLLEELADATLDGTRKEYIGP